MPSERQAGDQITGKNQETIWHVCPTALVLHQPTQGFLCLRLRNDILKIIPDHLKISPHYLTISQATIFYTNALDNPEVTTALARDNITAEKLQEGQTLVQQVADLNSAQEREKYEAQQATKDRDVVLDELDDWLTEFKEVAKLALGDRPQQLEALGFGTVA